MKLHRFFISDEIVGDTYVIQEEALVHQITRVLRLRKSDLLVLCTSDGIDHVAEIQTVEKKYVQVVVRERHSAWVPQTPITLYCSLIRKELFELVLQKATEIGVTQIVPLTTERTERSVVAQSRANRILREASEQCGRGDIPKFCEEQSLGEVMSNHTTSEVLIMFDKDGVEMPQSLSVKVPVGILIGPEGGWSPSEKRMLVEHQCLVCTLGPTTLRAETAAIVASSAVQRALR